MTARVCPKCDELTCLVYGKDFCGTHGYVDVILLDTLRYGTKGERV